MKFEGHTLIWGHINLWCLNIRWLMKNILVDFNLIGSKVIHGLNIQRKILHTLIVLKFRNTRLISKMKFEGHTLIWGHINLWCLNIRWLMKNILVDFNLIGSKVIHSLNIQRKILHFVSLVIYFQVSRVESQDQTHLLLSDSIVGKKLMMGSGVLFWLIWEKI